MPSLAREGAGLYCDCSLAAACQSMAFSGSTEAIHHSDCMNGSSLSSARALLQQEGSKQVHGQSDSPMSPEQMHGRSCAAAQCS